LNKGHGANEKGPLLIHTIIQKGNFKASCTT